MDQPEKQSDLPLTKKPYQKPQLRVYGDIRTISMTNTVSGPNDSNNNGSVHKTA